MMINSDQAPLFGCDLLQLVVINYFTLDMSAFLHILLSKVK